MKHGRVVNVYRCSTLAVIFKTCFFMKNDVLSIPIKAIYGFYSLIPNIFFDLARMNTRMKKSKKKLDKKRFVN